MKERKLSIAFLLYDRQAGQGELYTLNAQAHLSLLKSYSGWRTSWAQIIPIYIYTAGQGTPLSSLLFYDSTSGTGQFSRVDTQGNLSPSSPQTWSKGWTEIIFGEFVSGGSSADIEHCLVHRLDSHHSRFRRGTNCVDHVPVLHSEEWSRRLLYCR